MNESTRGTTNRAEYLWFPALILALGMVMAAFLLSGAVRDFRMADRSVQVNGLAEREVSADLAIWPISYNLGATTLEDLRQELSRADEAVVAFLKLRGFDDAEIGRSPPRITDQWTYAYGEQRPANRYTAERTLTLRSTRVPAARQALQEADALIDQGVLLAPAWGSSAQFLFTQLENIKPEMIAEATADARRAAAQFAEDSDSRLGGIKSARQGYFSINDLDESTPDVKRVRVVTTVEYFLEG